MTTACPGCFKRWRDDAFCNGCRKRLFDRDAIAAVVHDTQKYGGGICTLIHQLAQNPLFQTR